ncbi:NINE protein [Herbaspirillum robiniae]|uniref:NINE protein n=1 Tax=Herbaspirillum robiniae TaxID=2014887 RepID=UPI003D773AA6
MQQQPGKHKNKTLTTLIAAVLGGIGLHRFYLYGMRDRFGWLHILSVPLSLALTAARPDAPQLFTALPLVLSVLCACLEALVIGLTPDDKWDLKHNPASGRQSESHWILAVIIVLTVGLGAMGLIALLARSFDLLFTGGAFG